MDNIIIKKIKDKDKNQIVDIITKEWGSIFVISKGVKYNVSNLPGYLALLDNKIVGIITFFITKNNYEIITLNSFKKNKGIGTILIDKIKKNAKKNNINKINLITTNDNINAITFYQKQGFDIKSINLNSIIESRKLKPEIPETGNFGIPIKHEIVFELDI